MGAAIAPTAVALERFSNAEENRRTAYERRRGQIASLIANPTMLASVIEQQVAPVSQVSPKLGAQMALDMARALRAVQDAAPAEKQAGGILSPKRDKRFVSEQEIQAFAQAWEGIASPLSLLEDLRKATKVVALTLADLLSTSGA